MTVGDHKIEVVRRFKYLGTVINDSNNETEEIRAANKAYNNNKELCVLHVQSNTIIFYLLVQ